MKITLQATLLILIIILVVPQADADSLSVLFIGNSHTYYNDMPQMFSLLSESGGHTVNVDQSTPGGYTLMQHTTNQNTLDKISQDGWNYVILQENSQYPVIEYLRYNSMYPASRYLDSLIIENGGQTAFFLSWGWRYGGHFEIDGHESPVFEDYFEMQDTLTSAYTEIATELEAALVPVGIAWSTAVTREPELVLWNTDNYHPALNGSYLTACVFYGLFFNESAVGLTYTAGLDSTEALFLQQAAFESLTDIPGQETSLPQTNELLCNYPNPFNSSTIIEYILPRDSYVSLKVYDLLGREINTLVDCVQSAGKQFVYWRGRNQDGNSVSSGVYFYQLSYDSENAVKKMIYLK